MHQLVIVLHKGRGENMDISPVVYTMCTAVISFDSVHSLSFFIGLTQLNQKKSASFNAVLLRCIYFFVALAIMKLVCVFRSPFCRI